MVSQRWVSTDSHCIARWRQAMPNLLRPLELQDAFLNMSTTPLRHLFQSLKSHIVIRVEGGEFEWRCNASSQLHHLRSLAFLAKHFPAHLQDSFKSFSSSLRVFPKAFQACLLDLGLNLLPATTNSNDFCSLLEMCLFQRVRGWRPVDYSLSTLY